MKARPVFRMVVAVAIGLFASDVLATQYTFTKIVDNGLSSPFWSFEYQAALSNTGGVVYSGLYKQGGGAIAIGNGVLQRPVFILDRTLSGLVGFSGNVAVNDRASVAYLLVGPNWYEVRSESTPIAKTGQTFLALSPPTINHAGTVAFSALLGAGGSGIFVGGGGATTALYDSSGPFGNLFASSNVVINDSGRAAFFGNLDAGGGGIFTGAGGPSTTVALTNDPIVWPASAPFSMNNNGVVAFQGQRSGTITGIYTGNGGALTTVVEPGAFFNAVGTPSINNAGTVAFRGYSAAWPHTGAGIFTGADPVADKVVRVGDALDGSLVTDVQFYRQGLNDFGQVAFFARLADGRSAIFRADPPGMNQATANLPDVLGDGYFRYTAAVSGQWFDPPLALGYDYAMTTPDSLFTEIVQLPAGFSAPFVVLTEGTELGQFPGGASVDFVSLLGHGVSKFSIRGISPKVEPSDPLGFPLQIAFSTPTADFTQTAVVPEPGGAALLLAGVLAALMCRVRRVVRFQCFQR